MGDYCVPIYGLLIGALLTIGSPFFIGEPSPVPESNGFVGVTVGMVYGTP